MGNPFGLNEGVIERQDGQGRFYYEIRARNPHGNLGGSMPLSGGPGGAQFPRKVIIRAESFWFIRDPGQAGQEVYGDGSGPGAVGAGGPMIVPQFPPWSCIARWYALENGQTIGDWFYVGRGAEIDIPISMLGNVSVIGPGMYTPRLHIQYVCNDQAQGFFDNHGWLHVYQDWQW